MTTDLPATTPADKSKPHRVTGRLKTACLAMIYGTGANGRALEMDEAAKHAGLTTRALRKALEKRWVQSFLREQRAVLLQSLTAGNPSHLADLRANSPNAMARVSSIRQLEDMAKDETAIPLHRAPRPGLVINVINATQPAITILDGTAEPEPGQLIEVSDEGQ